MLLSPQYPEDGSNSSNKSRTRPNINGSDRDDRPVVWYVTAGQYPPGFVDGDRLIVQQAFEQRGLRVIFDPWNEECTNAEFEEKVAGVDFVYNGSPWDNWGKNMVAFLHFNHRLKQLGKEISNPIEVTKAGSNKWYLFRLAHRHGVAVVPTDMYRYKDRGEVRGPRVEISGATALQRRINRLFRVNGVDYDEIVMKPGSSGGSLETARFKRSQWREALEHMGRLHGADMHDGISPGFPQDVLVQPFRDAIERDRELAVVIINGKDGPSFTKASILEEDTPPGVEHRFHPDKQPHDLTTAERERALRVWNALKEEYEWKDADLIAVRVDFIGDELLEVEMIAPVKGFAIPGICRRGLDLFADEIAIRSERNRDIRLGRLSGMDLARTAVRVEASWSLN